MPALWLHHCWHAHGHTPICIQIAMYGVHITRADKHCCLSSAVVVQCSLPKHRCSVRPDLLQHGDLNMTETRLPCTAFLAQIGAALLLDLEMFRTSAFESTTCTAHPHGCSAPQRGHLSSCSTGSLGMDLISALCLETPNNTA